MRQYVYQRPKLYKLQSEAFFNDFRYAWIEGSTKSGKTVSCMAWILEQAVFLGKEGREFWWVAPVSGTALIAFKRMRRGIPSYYVRKILSSKGEESIELINGAIIRFKSGHDPDSLYGEDVWAAVMDEASRMKVEAFYAIRSTLTATRGQLRLIGNVKGRKNWFYQGCRKAEAGEPGHIYRKITAIDAVAAGVFPQEELDDARRALPDAIFRELYLCEPSDDGGNPFGIKYIKDAIRPLSSRPPVAHGVDLAKSIDWTVKISLDDEGATCDFHRWQGPWRDTIKKLRQLCGGSVTTAVDSTGVGDPIVEELQVGMGNFIGFKFTAQSKQMLMEGLAVAIQQGEVHYPDGVIVNELESFEYEYTRTGVRYTAPEGQHDDCVMGLALAVWAKKNQVAQPQVIVL